MDKLMEIEKFPAFDNKWSEKDKLQWFDDFILLLERIYPDKGKQRVRNK